MKYKDQNMKQTLHKTKPDVRPAYSKGICMAPVTDSPLYVVFSNCHGNLEVV